MRVHSDPDAEIVQTEHGAMLRGIAKVRQRDWPEPARTEPPTRRGSDTGEAAAANRRVPRGKVSTKHHGPGKAITADHGNVARTPKA